VADDLGFLLDTPANSEAKTTSTENASALWSRKLAHRYTDAYRTAGFVVGIGTAIKVLGFILGAVGFLGGAVLGSGGSSDFGKAMQAPVGIGLIVISVLIFVWFYILGVIVSSIGQMQKASVDSAVNNSPMLSN